MPSVDDDLQRRIHEAAPAAPDGGPVFDDVIRRKRRRSVTRRASAVGVVALVLAGAILAFAAVDRPSTVTPGASTPAPLAEDLGLPFPTCRVSSMPIDTGSGEGTAVVYTKMTGGECPARGDGLVGVGVDVTGDGVLDATSGPLPDCWLLCEAFAAPDVNGDGVSEVAVSTEGADGYGVSLFAITASPPSIEPIMLEGEPFQFPWVDVATHATSAGCQTDGVAPARFETNWVDKGEQAAIVTQRTIEVEGAVATKVGERQYRTTMDEAPMPGTTLCGVPISGSAAGLATQPGVDVGLATNLCDISTISADFTGDGREDTVWVGTTAAADRCPLDTEHRGIAAIDTNGDGLADGQTPGPFAHCTGCRAFAAVDFNADGASEFAVLLQDGTTPQYGIFEAALAGSGRDEGLYPVFVHPGSEQFPEGDPLTFWAGGDEGFAGAVKCEGFPDNPVLIVWASSHSVDAGIGSQRDVVMTKLTMQPDGSFAAVDALHQQQAVGDPPLFNGSGRACGVDWDPNQ